VNLEKAPSSLRVAVVQAAPVPGNLPASLSKALDLIEQAAQADATLICFGETFLPGYPAWLDHCPEAALWNNPAVKEVYAALRANSVVVPGPETEALGEAACKRAVGIVIGANERVKDLPGHGTLYNTLHFFDPQGHGTLRLGKQKEQYGGERRIHLALSSAVVRRPSGRKGMPLQSQNLSVGFMCTLCSLASINPGLN
jgi:Carbon-nitrogen hydrolase